MFRFRSGRSAQDRRRRIFSAVLAVVLLVPSAAPAVANSPTTSSPASLVIVPKVPAIAATAPHATFQKGDIFVSRGGSIEWRLPDWTLNATLSMGGGFASGIVFDSQGYLWAVDSSSNRLLKFNPSGIQVLATTGQFTDPRSIAADNLGNIYVGEHGWTGVSARIWRVNLAGQINLGYTVNGQDHSVDSMDMEPGGCIVHYIGTDDNYVGGTDTIRRYNVCTSQEVSAVGSRFNYFGWVVRALQDGGDLEGVSFFNAPSFPTRVTRWSASGSSQDFAITGASRIQALDLAQSGAFYYAGDLDNGIVFEVETATGTVLAQHAGTSVKALTVYRGGFLPSLPPPPGTEHNPPYENEKDGGDPVSTVTGTYSDSHVDVAIPGRGPAIQFIRAYNSNDTRVTTLGPGWTHSYNIRLTAPGDGSNDIILIGPQGRSDRYHESGGSFTPPPSVHRILVRNTDDTYTATDRAQTAWIFDSFGRLTTIRDRYGNASNLGYDANGRLGTVSDPAGRGVLTLGYDGNGRLTSVTDWASPARSVTYQYDSNGRLWKAIDREAKTTTFTYDGTSQRIASVTDRRGIVTLVNTYDAQGRVATQKDGRGVVTGEMTTFSYAINPDGTTTTTLTLPPTSFEPAFQPTLADTYDSNGFLVGRVTRPSSGETLTQSFTYDATGNQTSSTDPRNARTDYCYDVDYAGAAISGGAANLTRMIDPSAAQGQPRAVTLLKYDAKNNLIQSVSPRGVPSTSNATCGTNLSAINTQFAVDNTYDATGTTLLSTVTRFTDPDTGAKTATTKYEYGDATNPGRVTRVIPPRGNTTGSPDYTYAAVMTYFSTGTSAGELKDVTDSVGNKTSYTYDTVGRVLTLVDALGNAAGGVPADHTTSFTYDKEDRLRTTNQPSPKAGGTPLVTETRFDAVGSPIFRIDANSQVTGLTYDERNSLSTVVESAVPWTNPAVGPTSPITTEYLHDAGGNATRITRAKGDVANERVTDYTFDGRGLRRSETQYPAWPSTTGQLVTTTTYDPDGNQAATNDPVGRTTTYAYDARNRLTAIDYSDPGTADVTIGYDLDGNRVAMTDGTGASTYILDEAGRLVSATSPGPKVVGYRYDLDGHRTKLIYPDATAVTYTFDKAGRLGGLTDWASRAVTYTYWPDSLVKGATLPDGTGATYSYDNARRLVDVIHQRLATTISHQAYTLDRDGNVTNVADLVAGLTPLPTWSTPGVVNNVLIADQTRPSIAIGSDGSVYAVWADTRSGDSDVYFSRRDPATAVWSASERVNHVTTGSQSQPAIAFDPIGTTTGEGPGGLWIVWTDTRNGAADDDIYWTRRRPDGSWWSGDTRLNDDAAGKRQYTPALTIRPDGGATAIWYDERGGGGKKSIYTASLGLTANFAVTGDTKAAKGEPKIAIDSVGNVYAVWRDNRSGNADVWFASSPPQGGTWSTNTKISDDPGSALQDAPAIGVDTAGNLTVVWNDARTSPSQIRARRRAAGTTTWSPSVVIGGSTTNAPALAVRPDGRAYASWSNGTLGSLTTLWGSEFDPTGGTWSTPEQLTVGTEEAASASVAFTTGQLIVAYQRRPSGGNYDIYSRRKGLTGEESAFGYDSLDRLTSVGGPDGARSYTYDPVGNRLSRVAGPTTSYIYDRADRLTNAGGVPVTTDANGNLVARGSDAYSYDQANQLSSATIAGTTETYVYDGTGTRFSRQVGTGTPTRYVSDLAGGLPTVIDDGAHKFVYGVGLEYAASGAAIEVYHADRLGSTRAITNASGVVTAGYRTDEWGVLKSSTGSSSQPFGYTGEPADATGLTYLRARYYNPDLGRFMSRDGWFGSPTMSQSLNRYAYVVDNPVTRDDPSGHCLIDSIADVAFMVFDVGSLVFGPPKDQQGNWLALGADTAGLLIPCATGAGIIVRAGIKTVHGLGGLSRAAEFGVHSYSALRKAIKGTGLEAHHIIPQRFAALFGQNVNDMASVAVTQAEHYDFTQAWRTAITQGAGTAGATQQQVLDAAREIYKDYPDLLRAIGL